MLCFLGRIGGKTSVESVDGGGARGLRRDNVSCVGGCERLWNKKIQ